MQVDSDGKAGFLRFNVFSGVLTLSQESFRECREVIIS